MSVGLSTLYLDVIARIGEAPARHDRQDKRPAVLTLLHWSERRHSLRVPFRRRPKGPAGGQFSAEDRPDDPPLSEDDLLRQATGSAADPEVDAAEEAEPEAPEGEDEIRLLQDHFRGRAAR